MPTASLTRAVWDIAPEEFPSADPLDARVRFLLRYAILAPSSHNSQPWQFEIADGEVAVAADESRWLEVADPDRRELFVSVGCAVENLCVAAERFDFDPAVTCHDPAEAGHVATVTLDPDSTPSNSRPPALFDAVTERYTSHAPFEDRPLDDGTRADLAGLVDDADEVALHLVDDAETRGPLGELQAEADRLQMENDAYRAELGHWVGIGALGDSWLAARIGQAVVTYLDIGGREAAKNSRLVESAPAIAVLTTDSDDPAARVATGQAFERLALLASAEGIAVHPMSQTLERPELRERLAALLPESAGLPQHLFRLGCVDETAEHTPRWPLETFLLEA